MGGGRDGKERETGGGGGTTPDTSTKTDVIVYIVYTGNTKTQIYNRNSRLKLAYEYLRPKKFFACGGLSPAAGFRLWRAFSPRPNHTSQPTQLFRAICAPGSMHSS